MLFIFAGMAVEKFTNWCYNYSGFLCSGAIRKIERIKIGETTLDGLVRKYKEETHADIQVGKLLWIEECFGIGTVHRRITLCFTT